MISSLAIVVGLVRADTTLFTYQTAEGLTVFSDNPVEPGNLIGQSYRSTMRPSAAPNPCKGLSQGRLNEKAEALDDDFARAAARYSIDKALLKAIAQAESCFDPLAVSRAGARGLMQLMPGTAKFVGVSKIHDTIQNLNGGAKYLALMLERYLSDTRLALAAYNAGPGNVDRYGGIPPFPETQRYIETVMRFQSLYSTIDNST